MVDYLNHCQESYRLRKTSAKDIADKNWDYYDVEGRLYSFDITRRKFKAVLFCFNIGKRLLIDFRNSERISTMTPHDLIIPDIDQIARAWADQRPWIEAIRT